MAAFVTGFNPDIQHVPEKYREVVREVVVSKGRLFLHSYCQGVNLLGEISNIRREGFELNTGSRSASFVSWKHCPRLRAVTLSEVLAAAND